MVFGLVQKINPLDSQTKFQTFTLFTSCRIEERLLNRSPILISITFARNISKNIWTLGKRTRVKLRELLLYLSSIISQFLNFIHFVVSDFIIYCLTMHTLQYIYIFFYLLRNRIFRALKTKHECRNAVGKQVGLKEYFCYSIVARRNCFLFLEK